MISADAAARMFIKMKHDNRSLPPFNGDILAWPTFLRKYKRTTEEYELDEYENQERLQKALRGQANDW